MTNFVKSKHLAPVILLCIPFISFHVRAETYTIKKLNTPTININNVDMKVGDNFSDGAVIKWASNKQAMRVLSGKNELITMNAKNNPQPIRVRTIVHGHGKLSTRALACTSFAEHKLAFEGTNRIGHELIDSITVASTWRQDNKSFFELSYPLGETIKKIKLSHNNDGEIHITRDIFPEELSEKCDSVSVTINYINGRKGVTRLITSDMIIHFLPPFIE